MKTESIKEKNVSLKLQSPWVTTYNKVKALLEKDEDLKISELEEEDGSNIVKFKVDSTNTDKIIALEKIFKNHIQMGNIILVIDFGVINGDTSGLPTSEDYATAFKGNTILSKVKDVEFFNGFKATYVVFTKEVIQFYNDDISDYYGNYNGLAEDIAGELFKETPFVYFSTEV